jgi:hypothetical protein
MISDPEFSIAEFGVLFLKMIIRSRKSHKLPKALFSVSWRQAIILEKGEQTQIRGGSHGKAN